MLGREPTTTPFSTEALQANLLRLQYEWETVQARRNRDAIFQYLTAVFEIVMVWAKEGKAVKRAYRALHLRGYSSVRESEPFDVARGDSILLNAPHFYCVTIWGIILFRCPLFASCRRRRFLLWGKSRHSGVGTCCW